jgi:large subunit ribosomal protein L35
MKTRKGAAKRLKRTGTGKYIHYRAGARHIMSKKSAKRKRRLRRPALVKKTEMNRIKGSLIG